MEKDQIFILKDRGVIYINGDNVKNFLQNILTNDINKVDNNFSSFSSLLSSAFKRSRINWDYTAGNFLFHFGKGFFLLY